MLSQKLGVVAQQVSISNTGTDLEQWDSVKSIIIRRVQNF